MTDRADVAFYIDQGRVSSGRLTLKLDASQHLRVDAVVNGAAISAILDSGVSRSVIDRDLARSLGFRTRPGFRGASFTGDVEGELVDDLEIRVGALTVGGICGAVLDLSRFATIGDPPVCLLLGREIFETAHVEMDLPAGEVEIFPHAAPEPKVGRVLLPLRRNSRGGRHFPVSINGGPAVDASFDLGCSAPLLMSSDYAARSNVLDGRAVSTSAGLGAEGLVISRLASLRRLALGPVSLEDVPVEIPKAWNRESCAVVGLPVFSRFKIVTDYRNDRIALSPDPKAILAPFPKDRSGIGARRLKNGFEIVHVALESPAMSAGLRDGDEIVAIDDEEINDDFFKHNESIGTRPAGTTLRLRLSDGRTTTLILGEYY